MIALARKTRRLSASDKEYVENHIADETPAQIAAALRVDVATVVKAVPYAVRYRRPWEVKKNGKPTGRSKGGCYYLNYGRQIRLISAQEESPELEAEAWKKRAALLAGQTDVAATGSEMTVAEACAFAIEQKAKTLDAGSLPLIKKAACDFCTGYTTLRAMRERDGKYKRGGKVYGNLKVSQLKKYMIADWLGDHPGWQAGSTQRHRFDVVNCLLNFCVQQSRIEFNPIAGYNDLPPMKRRCADDNLTAEEIAAVIENGHPRFVELFEALYDLGCRPGELATVQVKHVREHKGKMLYVLPMDAWKCGKKTGEDRYIPLTDSWARWTKERLADLGENPEAHLFITWEGKPWTMTAADGSKVNRWGQYWSDLRKRLDIPQNKRVYDVRHTHITAERDKPQGERVDIEVLALKCGTSPTMIKKVYDHGDLMDRALSALS